MYIYVALLYIMYYSYNIREILGDSNEQPITPLYV